MRFAIAADAERTRDERLAQVSPSCGGRESRLWHRRPNTPQGACYRNAEVTGKIVRLVEATPQAPPRMQRHGDDRVGSGEDGRACRAHHSRKWNGQPAAAFVLEPMDDLAERAFVESR